MAKNQNQGSLAVAENGGPGRAIALPENLQGGAIIEGQDQAAQIGRMAMYQGTTEEQQLYQGCGFQAGDFIDVLEKRKVASARIVPVWAFITYVLWPQGSRTPVYVHKDKNKVPPADLEWHDEKPPEASKCINAMVLVDGERWPYLFVFKRTSLKVGETIFSLEARRGTVQQGRGCYELASKPDKGRGGQSYHQLTYRPLGDCPAQLHELLSTCIAKVSEYKTKAEQRAAEALDPEAPEAGGDNIPI